MEVCAEGIILFLVSTLLSSALGAPALSVDTTPSSYGTSETLKCTDATYNFGKNYIWEKDGNTIFTQAGEESTTGKYSESINGTTFKLIINNIDVSDEGTYTCNHAFAVSNSLILEVQSQGKVSAVLLSSKYLEVTFEQIYPNTSSAIITCDSTAVAGKFVTSVENERRFTNTWKSDDTVSTLPTSCSAEVTLRTKVNTAFIVASASTEAKDGCPGLGNSTAVDSTAECTCAWIGISCSIILGIIIIGMVIELKSKQWGTLGNAAKIVSRVFIIGFGFWICWAIRGKSEPCQSDAQQANVQPLRGIPVKHSG